MTRGLFFLSREGFLANNFVVGIANIPANVENDWIKKVFLFMVFFFFINLVRKTTSLQGVAIRTNLLIFDILFDNMKWCSPAGSD